VYTDILIAYKGEYKSSIFAGTTG